MTTVAEVTRPPVITPESTEQKTQIVTPTPTANVMSAGWPITAQSHAATVNRVAHQYSIDADMIAALISIESAWDTEAISSAGACGLTQVMPYGVADWTSGRPTCSVLTSNPDFAIEYGVYLLVIMYQHENANWERALGSYLCGYPDSKTGAWDTPTLDAHCRDYAQRIIALARSMKPPNG